MLAWCLPVMHDVSLEKTAELTCHYTYSDDEPLWEVNGSWSIHPLESNPVSPGLLERGFRSKYINDQYLILLLEVRGSVENNQTTISCKPLHGTQIIVSYILNVIGNVCE